MNFVLIITVGLWGVGASVSSEISTNRSWEKTNVRTSRRIRLKQRQTIQFQTFREGLI